MKKGAIVLVFLFSFLLYLPVKAQNSTKKDLRIGLVLSGGGAKGLAHIGALKVIEESGIRIDYIGGTSMGAVIGGLYAAGYSADQLDSIFRTTDFKTLIQDDLPRRTKNHYQRKNTQRYAITLPFNNFKLSFPSGLSKGQNIYNMLSELMYPVRNIHDFSKLPIPFFCIGTNIETGKRMVLDHGSLPQAVAASSAIPSLFHPVLIDGKLVSDGGITDNYPIEELKKHHLDYIIGVDVQDSLRDRSQLKSVFQILTQVNNFRTIAQMKDKRPKTDLYIKPDISDFTLLSFEQGAQIIKSGEVAAEKLKSQLDSLARLQHKPEKVKIAHTPDSVFIKAIDIEGLHHFKRNYIRGKLQVPTGKKVSFTQLDDGLNNLSATNDFDRIYYNLIPDKNFGDTLAITLQENGRKTSLRFGLHYDNLYKSAALINLTHKNLLFKGDQISTDIILGDNIRYNIDYFVDKGNYWSFGLNSHLNRFKHNIKFDQISSSLPPNLGIQINKLDLNYLDLTNQIFVETFFFHALRFGMGFEHKYIRMKSQTLSSTQNGNSTYRPVQERGNLFGPYGYAEYDSYDNHYFPNHGLFFNGRFHFYAFGAETSYAFNQFSWVRGKLGYALTPFNKFSIRAKLEMGFQIGANEMHGLNFFMGGYGNNFVNNIMPFFGYDFLSHSGNSYNSAAIQFDYHLFPKNHLMLGYNVANVGDDLFKHGRMFSVPDYSGFSLGYGLESILGPLEVHYSISPETGRSEWFFSLGYWF